MALAKTMLTSIEVSEMAAQRGNEEGNEDGEKKRLLMGIAALKPGAEMSALKTVCPEQRIRRRNGRRAREADETADEDAHARHALDLARELLPRGRDPEPAVAMLAETTKSFLPVSNCGLAAFCGQLPLGATKRRRQSNRNWRRTLKQQI